MSEQSHEFINQCKVNGCPLPVAHVTDRWPSESKRTKGKPRWGICEFHHEADSTNWIAVTKRILAQKKILQIIYAVSRINQDRFRPLPNEHINLWVMRIKRDLRNEFLDIKKVIPPVEQLDAMRESLRLNTRR